MRDRHAPSRAEVENQGLTATVRELEERVELQAARIRQLHGCLDRLSQVHGKYFDLDESPGFGDSCPSPEDVWRYDRDFRLAFRGEGG